jgi:oxygen-dependent protoporphyrinogen oxidase
VFIGGARAPELALRPHEEMIYDVHGELRRTFGICARPKAFELQLWPRAIPQYNIGYGTILDAIAGAEERLERLHLLGSYRGGVAVGDCVASARDLARRIAGDPAISHQEHPSGGEHAGAHERSEHERSEMEQTK